MLIKGLRTPVSNLLLVVTSIIMALLVGELILRQTEMGHYAVSDRVLFYTSPSFERYDDDTVRYASDTSIRSVAVYGNHVDYDVVYRSNNMGFIDHVPYLPTPSGVRNIVFVGDSFTAGSGSSRPWVGQLREMLDQPHTRIYSLGVGGAGIQQFARLLHSFDKSIGMSEANIMAISDDFFRRPWYPAEGDDGVWFCFEDRTAGDCRSASPPIIHAIERDATHDAIRALADDIYRRKGIDDSGDGFQLRRFRIYTVFCDAMGALLDMDSLTGLCPHLDRFEYRTYRKGEVYLGSIEALRALMEQFPKTRFRLFHIPEKVEVHEGKYSVNLAQELVALNIEYIPLLNACGWRDDMFHKYDSHPNDRGYANLSECMVKYL